MRNNFLEECKHLTLGTRTPDWTDIYDLYIHASAWVDLVLMHKSLQEPIHSVYV